MRRLPVYLIIDCSESMAGPAIDAVQLAVDGMVRDLKSSPHALETVALCVITFSSETRVLVPLTPIEIFQMPSLDVKPGTSLGRALDMLVTCLQADVVKTTHSRKGDWRPLVFLFTDGQPTDDWTASVKRLKELSHPRIANIYAIGCGDDVDYSVLHQITDIVIKTLNSEPESIQKAFVWITASVQSSSTGINENTYILPTLESDYGLQKVPKDVGAPAGEPRQVFIHARCAQSQEDYIMRFVRHEDSDPYLASTAHKLTKSSSPPSSYMPAIQSDRLVGIPPCPYCGNTGAAVCSCGGAFCIKGASDQIVTCPYCKRELTDGFTTAGFAVRQSAG